MYYSLSIANACGFCIINFIPHFFHSLWIKPMERWRSSNYAGHHVPLASVNMSKSLFKTESGIKNFMKEN